MASPTMWMVRGDRGEMYDLFREQGLVAIGWSQLADIKPGTPRAGEADVDGLYTL